MDKVNILGAHIDKCSIEQASDKIIEMIENNEKCKYVFTPNSEILMRAYRDKKFCDILNTAALLTADGIGVVYASKIVKNPITERCAGFDTACRLMEKMANKYADFPDDTLITARQENQESIHRHNAFAEKVTTMGELKEELDIQ